MGEQEAGRQMDIKDLCFALRAAIEDHLKKDTKALMIHSAFNQEASGPGQHEEMRVNIMLAYRHLEDARMRLGKVVQAYDGGKSVYPK